MTATRRRQTVGVALVLIVLCYLWIGLNETAAILAVTLNKIPNADIIRLLAGDGTLHVCRRDLPR